MREDLFTTDDVKVLSEYTGNGCVSIYMPTHRFTTDVQEDQIRFKNLIREAESKISEINSSRRGLPSLEPARNLLDDRDLWQHQRDGLALFLTGDFFRVFQLPLTFDELVVVGERFHLKPTLPLLTGDGHFHILALSQNEVRVFHCTRDTVDEIESSEWPKNLDEALKYDDPEKQLQFHTRTSSPRGDRDAMYHGHGVGTDDSKDRILRFFQQVDQGLRNVIGQSRAPIVLAAVDFLVPIYQEATDFPNVLDRGVTGNPEGRSPKELQSEAWGIVEPHFTREMQNHAREYNELLGTGKASNQIDVVVKAAYGGRVNVLFVAVGIQVWGRFDSDTNEVTFMEPGEPESEDLLDFAAIQTILHGGTVYAVKPEEVPDGERVAATFRY